MAVRESRIYKTTCRLVQWLTMFSLGFEISSGLGELDSNNKKKHFQIRETRCPSLPTCTAGTCEGVRWTFGGGGEAPKCSCQWDGR